MTPAYRAVDLAPYQRFRKTKFYGGCFTADIQFCNWTCDHCWSKYGWRNTDPVMELDSDQVVKRILSGLRRNGVYQARISGGEPSLYWRSHLRLVAEKLLTQTRREAIHPKGKTRGGRRPLLVVETNGTAITPADIAAFEEALGDEAWRLQLTIGVKATNPRLLAELTGQTPQTAARFRAKQLELVRFLARPERLVRFNALFLDRYTVEDELEAFRDEVEAIAGDEVMIDVQKFKTTGWGDNRFAHKHYTPKRERGAA